LNLFFLQDATSKPAKNLSVLRITLPSSLVMLPNLIQPLMLFPLLPLLLPLPLLPLLLLSLPLYTTISLLPLLLVALLPLPLLLIKTLVPLLLILVMFLLPSVLLLSILPLLQLLLHGAFSHVPTILLPVRTLPQVLAVLFLVMFGPWAIMVSPDLLSMPRVLVPVIVNLITIAQLTFAVVILVILMRVATACGRVVIVPKRK
jgi:hypothetical protein